MQKTIGWCNEMGGAMKVLVIDNYDSFTFNLVQYIGELGYDCEVFRNDDKGLKKIISQENKDYAAMLISPGPGQPEFDAGLSIEALNWAKDHPYGVERKALIGKRGSGRKGVFESLPVLGVCMGHQCMGYAEGAKIVRAKKIFHGKVSQISHEGIGIFQSLPNPLMVTRYHSLIIKRTSLPKDYEVVAENELNEIMAIRHRSLPWIGVQFHPESIATLSGHAILDNFFRTIAKMPEAKKRTISKKEVSAMAAKESFMGL